MNKKKNIFNEEKRTHPSYALVQINRISRGGGRTRLFGSPLHDHHATMRLTIKRGCLYTDPAGNQRIGEEGTELIEVELSAMQYAELLTTQNVGVGVPGTIRHIFDVDEKTYRRDIVRVEEPPDELNEAEKIRLGFADNIGGIRKRVQNAVDVVKKNVLSSVKQAKIHEVEIALDLIVSEVESNWPYVLGRFQEAAEQVTKAAKSEVDAFITHAVHMTGLRTLQGMKLLAEKNEDVLELPAASGEKK